MKIKKMYFMKKMFLIIAVLFAACFTVSAQTERTVLEGKEVSFGVNFGVNGYLSPNINGFNNVKEGLGYEFGLNLNKSINPVIGIGVDAMVSFPRHDEKINSIASHFLDLGLNGNLNLNNLIHGFKGNPDKVEALVIIGAGAERNFDVKFTRLYTKGGLKGRINIVDGWSFDVDAGLQYLFKENILKYNKSNSRFYVTCGFTKTFGKFKKSTVCDMSDFNSVNEEVNNLRAKNDTLEHKVLDLELKNKDLVDENNKLLSKETTIVNNNILPTIQFMIGQSKILPEQKASLEQICNFMQDNKDIKVTIIGYADSETGSEERNAQLSMERAESVKSALVDMGINKEQLVIESKGSFEQPFKENNSNRVVVFTEVK